MKKKMTKIFSIPFKVEFWDSQLPIEEGDDDYEKGMTFQGRYYSTEHKILVRSDNVPDERKTIILLHELLHAYDDLMRIKDGDNALSDAECDRLSLAIYDIIKEKSYDL
jgi:hypothetical protein